MTEVITSPASTSSPGPDLAARLLFEGLRRIYQEKGISYEQLARRVQMSRSSMERWLTGKKQNLSERDVKDLMEAWEYSRDDELTIRMVGLVRAARQRAVAPSPEWMDYFRFGLFLDLQRAARRINTYEQTTVPGLLQTRAFAEAVIRATAVDADESRVAEQVELRAERQQILYRDSPVQLHALIDESALWRITGSAETMRGQMDHLLTAGARDNITIQIMPFAGGPAAAGPNGSFVVMELDAAGAFDGTGTISYQETIRDADYGQTPEQAALYAAAFARLSAVALDESQSAKMIGAARDARHGQVPK